MFKFNNSFLKENMLVALVVSSGMCMKGEIVRLFCIRAHKLLLCAHVPNAGPSHTPAARTGTKYLGVVIMSKSDVEKISSDRWRGRGQLYMLCLGVFTLLVYCSKQVKGICSTKFHHTTAHASVSYAIPFRIG